MLSRGRALSGRYTMKLPNIFAKNAVAVRYAAGAIIFEIGQPPDLMFIVQEGEVDIKIGDKIVETVSAVLWRDGSH
jgi:CRP-like cAMP-binding protein